MRSRISDIRRCALANLIPPPRLPLSMWIEMHVRLPEGVSVLPGSVRLWPRQRGIAEAIGDRAQTTPALIGHASHSLPDRVALQAVAWIRRSASAGGAD